MGSYKDIEAVIKHTVVCICGESGAGKTTYAVKLNKDNDYIILDGDAIRKYITYDLGYSLEDRTKNNTIIANIAEMLYHQGKKVIISTVRADIAYSILCKRDIPCSIIKIDLDHNIHDDYTSDIIRHHTKGDEEHIS